MIVVEFSYHLTGKKGDIRAQYVIEDQKNN